MKWRGNAADGKRLLTLGAELESYTPVGLAWSPNGRYLVVGAHLHSPIRVWDTRKGRPQAVYEASAQEFTGFALAWSPEGTRLAWGSDRGAIAIWNALTGETLAAFPPNPLRPDIQVLAWSPDGARLAAAGSSVAFVLDVADGSLRCSYAGHASQNESVFITSLAWSPDGQRVASGARQFDDTAQVWNGLTGEHLATYRKPSSTPTSGVYVSWAPNGLHVASTRGSWDAPDEVAVWPVGNETGFTYRGHRDTILALAWSPDGTRIASGSADQSVQVWTVP